MNLSVEQPYLAKSIKKEKEGIQIIMDVNEDVACKLRDWAGKKLQKVGFDSNYTLTKQGEYLEDIIDLLYV